VSGRPPPLLCGLLGQCAATASGGWAFIECVAVDLVWCCFAYLPYVWNTRRHHGQTWARIRLEVTWYVGKFLNVFFFFFFFFLLLLLVVVLKVASSRY